MKEMFSREEIQEIARPIKLVFKVNQDGNEILNSQEELQAIYDRFYPLVYDNITVGPLDPVFIQVVGGSFGVNWDRPIYQAGYPTISADYNDNNDLIFTLSSFCFNSDYSLNEILTLIIKISSTGVGSLDTRSFNLNR